MNTYSSYKNIYLFLLALVYFLTLLGCEKTDAVFEDPYAGGKDALGIKFSTESPNPADGAVGTIVTFQVSGAAPYKDSLKFNINNQKMEVVEVNNQNVKVKISENSSSGFSSLVVGNEVFYGPLFTVKGLTSLDPSFRSGGGTDGTVLDALTLPNEQLVIVGGFTDFNHKGAVKPFNGIVLTDKNGIVNRTDLRSGRGVDGRLTSIKALSNGKMIVAGGFSSFDSHRGEINNITRLNKNGSLDTMGISTFTDNDTVPAFNGGVDGSISKIFIQNDMITAIGRFDFYLQNIYGQSDYLGVTDSLIVDSIESRSIVRLFSDGSIDSTFNYDYNLHKSFRGVNGSINDAFMQDDGKLIIVGSFTSYNEEPINRIVRLDKYGDIDRSFKVGNGADGEINSIRYNEESKRFVLAGAFRNFDGRLYHGVAILNEDGSIEESFQPHSMGNSAQYYFAQEISNGLVIVNGVFNSYDGVSLNNFMVLDETGNLAKGYNNIGSVKGRVLNAVHTKNALGQDLLMFMGDFEEIDYQRVNNVTRLLFDNM